MPPFRPATAMIAIARTIEHIRACHLCFPRKLAGDDFHGLFAARLAAGTHELGKLVAHCVRCDANAP